MTPPEVTAGWHLSADRRCGEHRPGLGRAWCYNDGEWCYENEPCRGCTIVVLQARMTALEAALRGMRRLFKTYPSGSILYQWVDTPNEEPLREALRVTDKALDPGAGGTDG